MKKLERYIQKTSENRQNLLLNRTNVLIISINKTGGIKMFKEERNFILNPLLLKRYINGEYVTLNVIHTSYKRETGWVLLFDRANQDFYQAIFEDAQFKNIERIPYDGE